MNRNQSQTSFWKTMWAIVWKDLTAERRSREIFSVMLVFSLLVVFISNFALDLNPKTQREITGGMLWITFTFAANLGLNRSMAIEKENNCLDGLLLAPVDRTTILFGKIIGNMLFILMVEIIMVPLFSIFNNVNLLNPGFLITLVLGSIGYVTVGTFLSTITVQTRTGNLLLPILQFPIVLPVIISAVRASTFFLQDQPMDLIWPNLNLIIAFNAIYLAAGYILFDYLVEE
ncbi:MAG: heme exporter protein CcmB [Anaerolineales bacterium]